MSRFLRHALYWAVVIGTLPLVVILAGAHLLYELLDRNGWRFYEWTHRELYAPSVRHSKAVQSQTGESGETQGS